MRKLKLFPWCMMVLAGAGALPAEAWPAIAITEHIVRDTRLASDRVYVILGEIHVRPGVRLTVGNRTTILIRNGDFQTPAGNVTGKAALIFDSGSRLEARTLIFRAGDEHDRVAIRADNGGVFFLGSAAVAEKDRVTTVFATRASRFRATRILVSYLGHRDPLPPPGLADADPGAVIGAAIGGTAAVGAEDATPAAVGGEGSDAPVGAPADRDDIDALSVIGVTASEWQVAEIRSEFSGDDGIDIENSDLTLQRVRVAAPAEDGLNITSSRVSIVESLAIDVGTDDPAEDRDIFDMEYDDGQPFLRLLRGCAIRIRGVFGDEMALVSDDLPQPDADGNAPYAFDGVLRRGQAFIYAVGD